MAKIAIIGAGSLGFSKRLTIDILTYKNLEDTHFALVDTDPERLEYAVKIMEKILKDSGFKNASYSASTDRKEVLKDTDYIISSILVGGYDAIKKEIDIPMKYGVDQCIGDTLGPGGIMRCLRTLPHLAGLARDVMELCPEAFILNYTNPVSMLCWGMSKAVPDIKLVGLCHSVQGTSGEWAKRLGYDLSEIDYECGGINHQSWFIKFERNGEDLLPRIRELAVDPEIWLGDTSRMEYVKHFGYPVTESSGHNSEYSAWFRKRPELVKQYCPSREDGEGWNGRSGYIKELYDRPDWKKQMLEAAESKEPVKFERSLEYGSRIINALQGNEPIMINGSVENKNIIDNLPQGCCVEVPCTVDKKGIKPQRIGSLPVHLAAINRTQINVQELAVEAALKADPEIVFQAMALDPLTAAVCSLDQIRAMTIELLKAHQEYIPEFKGKSLAKKPVLIDTSAEKIEEHIDPGEIFSV